MREKEGRVQGPAFCDEQGGITRAHLYEEWIMERLLRVQATIPGAISPEVDIYEQLVSAGPSGGVQPRRLAPGE
jgi:hypothetical protein